MVFNTYTHTTDPAVKRHNLGNFLAINTMDNTIFNYGGIPVVLEISHDYEDDCTKAWHDLVHAETQEYVTTIPWSPYSYPSDEEVELWIALGAPRGVYIPSETHESHRNFNSDVLEKVIEEQETQVELTYVMKR